MLPYFRLDPFALSQGIIPYLASIYIQALPFTSVDFFVLSPLPITSFLLLIINALTHCSSFSVFAFPFDLS